MINCKVVGGNTAALAVSRFLLSETAGLANVKVHMAMNAEPRVSMFHDLYFRNSNPLGRDGLHLANLAGVPDEDVFFSDIPASSKIYISGRNSALKLFPKFSDAVRYAFPCATEWLWPRGSQADESLLDFCKRRFPRRTATRLANSLASVFTAGPSSEVSAASAAPRLFYAEKQWRSLLFSPLFNLSDRLSRKSIVTHNVRQRAATGGRLWTIRGGTSALIAALKEELTFHPRFSQEDLTAEKTDLTIYTSPSAVSHDFPEVKERFPALFRTRAVTTVRFLLPATAAVTRSAGFWLPVEDEGAVFGGWFHAHLFPDMTVEGESYLHISGRVDREVAEHKTLMFLKDQLKVSGSVEICEVSSEDVPAFGLGHAEELRMFNEWRTREAPKMQVCGPGFYAAAITDVVSDCKDLSLQLAERYRHWPLVENELPTDWSRRGGFLLTRQTGPAGTRTKVVM